MLACNADNASNISWPVSHDGCQFFSYLFSWITGQWPRQIFLSHHLAPVFNSSVISQRETHHEEADVPVFPLDQKSMQPRDRFHSLFFPLCPYLHLWLWTVRSDPFCRWMFVISAEWSRSRQGRLSETEQDDLREDFFPLHAVTSCLSFLVSGPNLVLHFLWEHLLNAWNVELVIAACLQHSWLSWKSASTHHLDN